MKFSKLAVFVCAACSSLALCAYPHHHHHHHGTGFAIGAGILGAGLLASTIYEATHPVPYVAPAPVVVPTAPVVTAPVVVQQPVVQQQVVVQQPVVQQPVYETRTQNVWIEGRYVDQANAQGATVRVWQPGHYEAQQVQVRVQ